MEYTASDVAAFLTKGESEVLEYRRDVSPKTLAKWISAFANSHGGHILVGVDEDPRRYSVPTVVGVNPARLKSVYKTALKQVNPQPQTVLSMVTVNDKTVGVIEVEKSDQLIMSEEGIFNALGASVQAMEASAIVAAIKKGDEQDSVKHLAEVVSQLTQTIEKLHKQIDDSGSWKRKTVDYILGGIVGAVIGAIIGKL